MPKIHRRKAKAWQAAVATALIVFCVLSSPTRTGAESADDLNYDTTFEAGKGASDQQRPRNVDQASHAVPLEPGRLPRPRVGRENGSDGIGVRPPPHARSHLIALYMDEVSSMIRKAWATRWLPQLRRSVAAAEEQKALAPTPEEGERLALRGKARTFARLVQISRHLLSEIAKHYEALHGKNTFKYFTDHVKATIELSFVFVLKLMAKPVVAVGDLAYLAKEEEKVQAIDAFDSDPQILTPDGRLVPVSAAVMQRIINAAANNQALPVLIDHERGGDLVPGDAMEAN